MKNYSRIFPLLSLVAILFLSSCSSNLFTGRKFNLDLVKVDKNKTNQVIRKDSKATEIKTSEALVATTENSYVEIAKPDQIENWEISKPKSTENPQNIQSDSKSLIKENTKKADDKIAPKSISKPNKSSSSKSGGEWDWASIVSLSAGVLGLFVAALPLGICAIVFGAIGMSRTSGGKRKGKGFAIAGLILGILEVLLIFLVLGLLLGAAA
jgi:hypothetical protein